MDPTAISLSIALAGGIILGTFYYAGLVQTIRWVHRSRQPIIWSYVSFVFRLIVVAIGLFAIAHGDIGRMIAAATGIFTVRALYLWSTEKRSDGHDG